MAYVNYIFFRKLKINNIKIENIISWHENQLVDKGWSFGIKKIILVLNFWVPSFYTSSTFF